MLVRLARVGLWEDDVSKTHCTSAIELAQFLN